MLFRSELEGEEPPEETVTEKKQPRPRVYRTTRECYTDMVRLRATGMSFKAIADKIGMSRQTVAKALRGEE